ncbi:polyphosphate kinase 1, partial [Ellagibacter isourolithinifaciens]|uniref:polyphosphate kinase 1 n=1 Tax=Ellagibacter isourolithinifaciens TaxID=2137581 RepID=UPI003A8F12C9
KKSKGKPAKEPAKNASLSQNVGAEGTMLGLIPLPRQCARVVKLPGDGFSFILLEHVVEMVAEQVFSMYTVKHTNVICVTRNADIDATESTDENDEDYREHMKRILKKRARLAPVRLESERELSDTLEPLLLDRLNLKKHQMFTTSVPLDLSFTWSLASHLSEKQCAALVYPPFTPQWPACLDRKRPIMDQVTAGGDVLLSYPYESMDPFVQLLREASRDPRVISIKITLYRLASQSHLAEALIDAAENGKEVTALFELRARFDESNNIEWSQRFEQAGCNVIYGFRDYKVHSKICCITRQTDDGIQHITQLGTGNYNEKTAKLYTDLSLITTSPTIGRDATEFFRNMALENVSDNYDVLWVAPLQVKPLILKNIDHQIELARRGEPCGLFFKTNSVTDKEIIDKIAEASQAGVKTVMLVRGISCLVPGVEGYTENVRVVSIVGRMLEHSRIYGFGPRTNMKIYLASADLMTRNMDKRVEIAWPVLDEKLRDRILSYIDVSLSDTAKLRELLPNRRYTPLGFFAQVSPEGKTIRFDSQVHFMDEARLKARMSTEVEVEREVEKREVEKREVVAAAEPATPVTATAPAAAAAAPAGTATPATSEAATVPPEATSTTSSAAPADAASTSEPALEPDAIEPAEKATTTAILPHIEQPPHKPSLLVRALAAAIRLSNRRK